MLYIYMDKHLYIYIYIHITSILQIIINIYNMCVVNKSFYIFIYAFVLRVYNLILSIWYILIIISWAVKIIYLLKKKKKYFETIIIPYNVNWASKVVLKPIWRYYTRQKNLKKLSNCDDATTMIGTVVSTKLAQFF